MENTRIFYKYVKEKNVNGQWCIVEESRGELSHEEYYDLTLEDTLELWEDTGTEDFEDWPRFTKLFKSSSDTGERTTLTFDFIDSEVA